MSVSATIGGTADFKNDNTNDGLSRMTRVEQNGNGGSTVASKRASFEYNALGQITKLQREHKPSGSWQEIATTHFTYDNVNRLTHLDHQRGGTNLFTGMSFTYDAMNRVTQAATQDGTASYSYDKNSRLTAADYSYQTDESFGYDANGNRNMTGYTVGAANRILSDGTYDYTYDDEGNLIRRTNISTGYYTEYVWDYRNRLTQVLEKNDAGTLLKQFDYKYDVYNRRIQKSVDNDGPGSGAAVGTRYVWDGRNVVFTFDGNNALTHRYLSAPNIDAILADEDALNSILTPLLDNLGSVTDLVNTSGTVQNHITYGAFGNITSETAPSVNFLMGYGGMQTDEETGLNYALTNYANSTAGTFLTPAPLTWDQGFNASIYAQDSPTNFTQPTGQTPVPFNSAAPPFMLGGQEYAEWYRQWMINSGTWNLLPNTNSQSWLDWYGTWMDQMTGGLYSGTAGAATLAVLPSGAAPFVANLPDWVLVGGTVGVSIPLGIAIFAGGEIFLGVGTIGALTTTTVSANATAAAAAGGTSTVIVGAGLSGPASTTAVVSAGTTTTVVTGTAVGSAEFSVGAGATAAQTGALGQLFTTGQIVQNPATIGYLLWYLELARRTLERYQNIGYSGVGVDTQQYRIRLIEQILNKWGEPH
jgi:RHS repeat-associated protein